MCKANRIGLVPKKIMVTRGGRTFMQTVYINPNQDTPQAPTNKVDFGEFERLKKLDRAKALKYLMELGVTWKESENPGINLMRASMAAKKASGGVESKLTVNLPKEALAPTLRPSKQMRERDLQEILAKLNPIEFDLLDRKSKVQLLKKELGTDGVRQLAEKLNLNWLHNDHPSVDYMRLSMALAEWIKDKTMNQLRLYSTNREPINVDKGTPDELEVEVLDKANQLEVPESSPQRSKNLAKAINKIKDPSEYKAFKNLGIIPEDDDSRRYLLNTLIPQATQQTSKIKTSENYVTGLIYTPGNPVNQTLWYGLQKASKLPNKVFNNGGIVRSMYKEKSLSNIMYTAPRATLGFPEDMNRYFGINAIIDDIDSYADFHEYPYTSRPLSASEVYVLDGIKEYQRSGSPQNLFKKAISQFGENNNVLDILETLRRTYSSYEPTKELVGGSLQEVDEKGLATTSYANSLSNQIPSTRLRNASLGHIVGITPPSVAKKLFDEKKDGFIKVLEFIGSKDKTLNPKIKEMKDKYKQLLDKTGHNLETLKSIIRYYDVEAGYLFSYKGLPSMYEHKEVLQKQLEQISIQKVQERDLNTSRAYKELIIKLWGEETGKELVNHFIRSNQSLSLKTMFKYSPKTGLNVRNLDPNEPTDQNFYIQIREHAWDTGKNRAFPKKQLTDLVPGTDTPVWKWLLEHDLNTSWFAPSTDALETIKEYGRKSLSNGNTRGSDMIKDFLNHIPLDEFLPLAQQVKYRYNVDSNGKLFTLEKEQYLQETIPLLTKENHTEVIGLLEDLFGIKYSEKLDKVEVPTGPNSTTIRPEATYSVSENGTDEELDTVISNLLTVFKQEKFFSDYKSVLGTRLPGASSRNLDKTLDRVGNTAQAMNFPFIQFKDEAANKKMVETTAYGETEDYSYKGLTPEQALERYKQKANTAEYREAIAQNTFNVLYKPELLNKTEVMYKNSEEGQFIPMSDWKRALDQQLQETPIVTNEKRKEIKTGLVGYTKENVDRLKYQQFLFGQPLEELLGSGDGAQLADDYKRIAMPAIDTSKLDENKIKWEYISNPSIGTSVWFDTVDSGSDTADTIPLNHPLFPQLQKTFLNIVEHTPRAETKARSKKQKEMSTDELYWRKFSDIYGLTEEQQESNKPKIVTKAERESLLSSTKCSLAKVPQVQQNELFRKVKMDWDQIAHGRSSADLYGAYEIKNLELENDFKKAAETVKPEPEQYYHGTSFGATAGILGQSGRFRVPKDRSQVVTGAMLGYGVYLAKKSSKSAQYLSSYNYSRHGAGTLFLCDVIMGQKVQYGTNRWMSSDADTVEALSKNTRLANDEWRVRKEEYVLPRYLINMANKSRR